MLLICEPRNLEKLQQEFKKWSLDAVVLGEVQNSRTVKLMWGAEVLTEIDPDLIVEKAPQYKRPYSKWNYPNRVSTLENRKIQPLVLIRKQLQRYLLNHHLWIHNQFDQRVGARTAMACESSVAFARLDFSGRGLGLAVGCRPEVMLMDAEIGALDAVYYPAFQMAIKGAKTLAVTDCLNFGNPQKTEIMSEFVASVEAIVEASKKLDAPVISGNVSFYNETLGDNIISTPAIGVVGIRENVNGITPDIFSKPLENIISVKMNWVESWIYHEQSEGQVSTFTFDPSRDVAGFITKCTGLGCYLQEKNKNISAIKAVGLGGIGITCLKMSQQEIGFDLSYELSVQGVSELFKDTFYEFILSTDEKADEMIQILSGYFSGYDLNIKKIGETRAGEIKFSSDLTLNFNNFKKNFFRNLEQDLKMETL